MTRNELIIRLIEEVPNGNTEIMLMDSHNGEGFPRTINFGPVRHKITKLDVDACGDCEDLGVGKKVVVLGFGCY